MNIVSYGGGTNSTALIIEMINRRIRIDRILFADTGGERPDTYSFINTFSLWVYGEIGIDIEVVRDKRTLEDDCIIRNALPAIAYGYKSCSLRFKVAPQKRAILNIPKDKRISFIAYDAGEPWRAKHDIVNNRYPLIDWGINRNMCINIIRKQGLPLPGKSSCFFCPNMKPKEILSLPNNLQDRAIEIERNAKLTKIVGLGRTWKWENLIMDNRNQQKFDFKECNVDIPCECYD